MSDACLHGFDVDVVARALHGELSMEEELSFRAHLPSCAACEEAARMHERLRTTWRASIDADAAYAGVHRERRILASGRMRARGKPGRTLLAASFGAAVGGLLVAAWFSRHSGETVHEAVLVQAPAVMEMHAAQPAPSVPPASAPAPALTVMTAGTLSTPPPGAMIAGRGCASCTRETPTGHRELTAGSVLDQGESIQVPRGATLMVGWSVADGLVDPASFVDVEGPASVRAVPGEGTGTSGGALVLTRGVARAQARRPSEVSSALVRTRGQNATWRIDARSDRTLVKVIDGEITVEELGASHRVTVVHAGEHVEIVAEPVVAAVEVAPAESSAIAAKPTAKAAAPFESARAPALASSVSSAASASAAPAAPTAPLVSEADIAHEKELALEARQALLRGERGAAEGIYRALAESALDIRVRDRAAFSLAQIELGRGERTQPRARLTALLVAQDPLLAADAAFLLAQSSATPRDRADTWTRYLASPRPSPQLEQATVELANALVDAGDDVNARIAVASVRARPSVPDIARPGLARVEALLTSRAAEQVLRDRMRKLSR